VKAVPKDIAQQAFDTLTSYRGKDLRKLDNKQVKDVLEVVSKLLPARPYDDYFDFRPWHIWDLRKNSAQPIHVLFEVNDNGLHPGTTGIRITEFGQSPKMLSETTFGTGWRCYLRDVKPEAAIDGEYPLLALETDVGAGPGPNICKQYYAKIGSGFELVRLENSDGTATRNAYYITHFRCGPAALKQSETEWEADLLAKEKLRVLRALVWLGGIHWELKADDKMDPQYETRDEVLLVRNIRKLEKVIARLKELANSKDRWLEEGARLTMNPQDSRVE